MGTEWFTVDIQIQVDRNSFTVAIVTNPRLSLTHSHQLPARMAALEAVVPY